MSTNTRDALVGSRSRPLLLLALMALIASTGCKKPEEKLAGHAEELEKILDDNMDEPEDGIEALREYLRDEGPSMARLMAELWVEVDDADSKSDRTDRAEEIKDALEDPIKDLYKTAMKFSKKARKDDDAREAMDELLEDWEPVFKKFAKAASGGSRAGSKYARRAKTTEAIDQLDKIYKSAANYYTAPRVAKGTGAKIEASSRRPRG